MVTRQELLALAANAENIIARTTNPAEHQLEQRDRIIAAAHEAGITDAEIRSARQTPK